MGPLLLAALRGDKEALISAVNSGTNLTEILGDEGETLLHLAAKGGHQGLMIWLLAQGLNLEDIDEQSRNVMHYAAAGGHFELALWLNTEKKLDLWSKDHHDKNIINHAAEGGKKDFILSLVNAVKRVRLYSAIKDLARGGLLSIFYDDTIEFHFKCYRAHERLAILCAAAQGGHLELIEWLCNELKFSLEEDQFPDTTIIHHAAQGGHEALITHFTEEQSDIRVKDIYGKLLIHYAALGGHQQLIELWVSRGIFRWDEVDDNNVHIGHLAAQGNHKELLTWLSLNQSSLLYQKDKEGRNILHYAAYYGHRSLLQYLTEELDFYLEEKDDCGRSVLHWAALGGYQQVIQWLIEKKDFNVNEADNRGKNALHYAIDFIGHRKSKLLIKWLVTKKNAVLSKTKGHKSAERDLEYQASIEWAITLQEVALHYQQTHRPTPYSATDFVSWTLPVNNSDDDMSHDSFKNGLGPLTQTDHGGRTLLHFAAYAGCMAIVQMYQTKFIIPIFAMEKIRDMEGKTAFHYAAEGGQRKLLETLRDYETSAVVTYEGSNLIHSAALGGQQDLIDWMIKEKKFTLQLHDKHGKTALHYAAEGGHYSLIIAWINGKIFKLMDCDDQGRTVLHFAAYNGHKELIERLSTHPDFDIKAKTYHDRTALHYAALGAQEIIFEWLVIEHEFSIDDKDKKQKTPLDYCNHNSIHELLRIHKENEVVLSEAERLVSQDLATLCAAYDSTLFKAAFQALDTELFTHEHRLVLLQSSNEAHLLNRFSDFRERNNLQASRFMSNHHKARYDKISKKIQTIESAYRKIIHHPEIRNNWVRVRIWESGQYPDPEHLPKVYQTSNSLLTIGYRQIGRMASKSSEEDNTNVGHVSIETARGYMSFWPAGNKSEIVQGRGARMNNSLLDDKLAEGPYGPNNIKIPADPSLDKIFFSLDSKSIDKKCDDILKKIHTRELQYGIANIEYRQSTIQLANCVTVSVKLLLAGKIEGLINMIEPNNITLPYWLKIQVDKAVTDEEQQFPIVKSLPRPENEEAFPYVITKEKNNSLYKFTKDYCIPNTQIVLPQGTVLWGKYSKNKLAYELIDDNDFKFEIPQTEAEAFIMISSSNPLISNIKLRHK